MNKGRKVCESGVINIRKISNLFLQNTEKQTAPHESTAQSISFR